MKLICRQIINQLLGVGINVSQREVQTDRLILSCAAAVGPTASDRTARPFSLCLRLRCSRQYEKLSKLTHSARIQFDAEELKAMVAALHFIFLNSARYDVDSGAVLPMELQQLGLPRDICTAIVRAYQQAKEQLRTKLQKDVLSRTTRGAHARACASTGGVAAAP